MNDDYGPYRGTVELVERGDTIRLMLDVGFDLVVHVQARLAGVQAADLDTDTGRAARDRLRNMISLGAPVTATVHHWTPLTGSCVATIRTEDGRNLSSELLQTGIVTERVDT